MRIMLGQVYRVRLSPSSFLRRLSYIAVTFQQFNQAKQLILDLLEYGMTPEDIAEIGVSRRLVVYALRELKIRLPRNIACDDIVLAPDLLPLDDSDEVEF
jgi:hypothetical protein